MRAPFPVLVPACGPIDKQRRHSALVDLPPELLTAICAHLACPTIVRCRVCHRLKDVIDASLELQYRIELARDGMLDAPAESPLNVSDRLARLRQLRTAWRTLRWTRRITVPMPGPCCAYELVGGMFCKTQPRPRTVSGPFPGLGPNPGFAGLEEWLGDMPGNWFEDGDPPGLVEGLGGTGAAPGGPPPLHEYGSRIMSATWLPGREADDHPRTVVQDDLGIPTRDFAIDPSQDLMVLFKGGDSVEEAGLPAMTVFPGALELHVRTISTNQTHPEARLPVLCTPVLYPVTSVFVQIVDDVVGMMYCVDPARPRITIWNWKTGHLVVDRGSGNLPAGTWDFSFINSRALLVTTSSGSGTLELFTFTCGTLDVDPDPCADPGSDSDSDAATPTQPHVVPHRAPASPLVHVATLHLPPVHPSVRMLNIGTHTGPYLAGCPPGKPFAASNAERIHVLSIQYVHLPMMDGPRTRPKICLFVHNRLLEGFLGKRALPPSVGDDAGASDGEVKATVVPWHDWGRTHARMMPNSVAFQWLRYVHGERVVLLLPTPDPGKSTVQVLDFNARRTRDESDEDETEDDEGNIVDNNDKNTGALLGKAKVRNVDYTTRIDMPSIFVEAVESGLPYREVCRDVQGDYSGMMIDDERLVGLKFPAYLTGDMKEIDVFTM